MLNGVEKLQEMGKKVTIFTKDATMLDLKLTCKLLNRIVGKSGNQCVYVESAKHMLCWIKR